MKRLSPVHIRRTRARRGVLLLVVLSLLVLFALIGVTFVLVTSQHLRAQKSEVKNEQYGDDPRRLLDGVLSQIVRDTTNPNSVLGTHSLLNDMYGNDGVKITGGTPTVVPRFAGQMLDLQMPTTVSINLLTVPPTAAPLTTLQQPGYLNGCVLTAIGGAADNRSTRIVGWGFYNISNPNMNSGQQFVARIMPFDGVAQTALTANPPTALLINGRPFNGTGFGFNPTPFPANAPTLLNATAKVTGSGGQSMDVPLALLPNPVDIRVAGTPSYTVTLTPPTYGTSGGPGGADEDYDAPDAQNMLLAYLPLNPKAGAPGAIKIIPSLHRPDTIANLRANPQFLALDDEAKTFVLRKLSMRPTHLLQSPLAGSPTIPEVSNHPNFPALNQDATQTPNDLFGPFDVDNDGDGIKESIWVDVGFPVQTAPDGRKFKPMAAILCLDLDGRLNVNAQGSIAHVDQYFLGATPQAELAGNYLPAQAYASGTVPSGAMPRGQGLGPPEINLAPLFVPLPTVIPPNALPAYAALLGQRYREPNTNLMPATLAYNSASQTTSPFPGITNFGDFMAALKFTDFPISSFPDMQTAYPSPMDPWGKGYVALDMRGMPTYRYMQPLGGTNDNPYELNLSAKAVRGAVSPNASTASYDLTNPSQLANTPNPADSPFTAGELERVLRMFDLDASNLPDRLRKLVDSSLNGSSGPPLALVRNMVTTDSFDLPSPSILATRDMRNQPIISASIADLLVARLNAGGYTGGNVAAEIQKMLSPELIAGQRMDINRLLGNSRDDDNDKIVDEPDEAEAQIWDNTMRTPSTFTSNTMPYKTNGIDMNLDSTSNPALARHLLARHLYVLMMLLKDAGATLDYDGDGVVAAGAPGRVETAYAIAQWAVNVVDFRDRDSIMTPFEFDINPFNGWTVDGDLTTTAETDRGVVWGCERPELLITETLAFHDRRTEDLKVDAVSSDHSMSSMMNPDLTFDQRLAPRGSLFIELYNPWVTEHSTMDKNGTPAKNVGRQSAAESSAEFYDLSGGKYASGVGLNGRVSAGGGGAFSPIWRMLIVTDSSLTANPPPYPVDPDPMQPAGFKTSFGAVERAVYFVNFDGTTTKLDPTIVDHGAVQYMPSQPAGSVLPGRYAVIGSPGVPGPGGSNVTPLGRGTRSSGTDPDTAQDGYQANVRQIMLTPSLVLNQPNQVQILNNGGPAGPNSGDMQAPVAVVMNKKWNGGAPVAASMNVSEPPGGYIPAPTLQANGEWTYASALDIPLDDARGLPSQAPGGNFNMQANPNPKFRYVHLQRLANPTLRYHPTTNPYLTIDTAPIPLTVFNGVGGKPEPNFTPPANGILSIQRGDGQATPPNLNSNLIWKQELPPTILPPPIAGAGTNNNFSFVLPQSLGYLNRNFGTWRTAADATGSIQGYGYEGTPKVTPFPWLTWNNSPFLSPMELMLVPKSRPSRLTYDYANILSGTNGPYFTPVAGPTTAGMGHLVPFFRTPTNPTTPDVGWQRIFEYVQVPSRFVGTERYLNPNKFGTSSPGPLPNPDPAEQKLMSFYHAPFNKVSNYRDPGRVNINTIPGDDSKDPSNSPQSAVWTAILNGMPGRDVTAGAPVQPGPTWASIVQSRQGTRGGFNFSASSSLFGNPFRSAAGASLLLPGTPGTTNATLLRDELDVTLLRPLDPKVANAPGDIPLFDYTSVFQAAGTQAPDDPTRNPYFRIKNLQRMSNLLTTRSNVYAVWITVGYFEVSPNSNNPDGLQIDQELGSDSGEVKRHRAFYIYDRSIPVGFEPGHDHNYENGILVRRFIE